MKFHNNVRFILAIDSGATKSEVLLYPSIESGKEIIRLYNFPFINLNLLGFDESLRRLKKIVSDISRVAGKGNIAAVAAGISGARYEKDRKRLAVALRKTTGIKKIYILPDTEIAFHAAFEKTDKNCGILIAGTGSALYYRDRNGKINRTGGWGRHIGDEGSGYWIAREALYEVTGHYDGRKRAEMLAIALKKEFGIDSSNIIDKIYHKGFEKSKFTKHVFRCAEAGDKISGDIIKSAAEKLAEHFIPLKRNKYIIAMTGSLFTEERLLAKELKKAAVKKFPNIKLVKPEFSPVWGAVKYALLNAKLRIYDSR